MNKIFFLSALFMLQLNWGYGAETDRSNLSWLSDFFKSGISSAHAEYNLRLPKTSLSSQHYYKQLSYSIAFYTHSKNYTVSAVYEFREDWNVLTNSGTKQPDLEQRYFINSEINGWTNKNGLGFYTEKYFRELPNWLVFDELDILVLNQCKASNPLPTISGLFFLDELKALKKIYREQSANQNSVKNCFEFDKSGNVVSISEAYLNEFTEEAFKSKKMVDDFSIAIRNKNDDVIFVKPIIHPSELQLIEGLMFKSGDKKVKIFSFELNRCFSKFVPNLVADPDELILNFVTKIKDQSGFDLNRISTKN